MRLIDADAFLMDSIKEKRFVFGMTDILNDQAVVETVYSDLAEALSNAPTVNAKPVRYGQWLLKKHRLFGNTYDFVCSECGCDYALAKYIYCPNCGAKMDGRKCVPRKCGTCSNDGWDMPQCRECNEGNDFKWYKHKTDTED